MAHLSISFFRRISVIVAATMSMFVFLALVSQGITETRNSVIGRYFLFHIQYHFNTAKK